MTRMPIASLPINHEEASHKIVGTSTLYGSGILGFYSRNTVGNALQKILCSDPTAHVRVEPHNTILEGKALRSTDVEWVVGESGDLGVKIGAQLFFLYKGESLMYETEGNYYRPVEKREFGESCKAPDKSRYTEVPGKEDQYDLDQRGSDWKEIDTSVANSVLVYNNP